MKTLYHFILFCRPHTIIGTFISITALYVIAGGSMDNWEEWGIAIIACLGANIYIVGLNQWTDIEIDRINKPYLPLASGAFSVMTGKIILFTSLIISLVAGYLGGYWLMATILISLTLGTLYSLPPFRLKRYYFWAAFCIIAIRGLIVNLLMFGHFSELSPADLSRWPPVIIWLTITIFVYSIIIAWFKDIPDMEGDKQYQIKTLSLIFGPVSVFRVGNFLLLSMLFVLVSISYFYPFVDRSELFIYIHLVLALSLIIGVWMTRASDKQQMKRFYQFLWLLFFLEYISFAIAEINY
jgi:homogentisate phytyltransferase / homogentisate geranylgeranyltransferase